MACGSIGEKTIFPSGILTVGLAAFLNSYYTKGRLAQQYINILPDDIQNFIDAIAAYYGAEEIVVSHHSEHYGEYSFIIHDNFAIALERFNLRYEATIVSDPTYMQNLIEIVYNYRME